MGVAIAVLHRKPTGGGEICYGGGKGKWKGHPRYGEEVGEGDGWSTYLSLLHDVGFGSREVLENHGGDVGRLHSAPNRGNEEQRCYQMN